MDFFLCGSASLRSESPAVPKWIKFIIALLLLPVCAGAAMALWQVLCASGRADVVWVPLLAGAACWGVVFLLLPKPMWIYVFGHELTHALWTWIFGGQVKKMKVSSDGGHVVISKSNFVIALAPYFFPLYAVLVIARVRPRPLLLELGGLSGLVPSGGGRGVCVSRDADVARLEDAANGHHVAGLVVFGGDYFSRQRQRAVAGVAIADRQGRFVERTGLVAGGHRAFSTGWRGWFG